MGKALGPKYHLLDKTEDFEGSVWDFKQGVKQSRMCQDQKSFCVLLSLQGPVNICLSDFLLFRSYLGSISSDVVSVP